MKEFLVKQELPYAVKKVFSLLLSIVMLINVTTIIDLEAYAKGWIDNAKNINFNTVYTESSSAFDTEIDCDLNCHNLFVDAFKFTLDSDGKVTLNIESEDKYYFSEYGDYAQGAHTEYSIYSSSDICNPICLNNPIFHGYNSSNGLYYVNYDIFLKSGTYYLVVTYKTREYDQNNSFYTNGSYNFSLNFKPNISVPSVFKVSSRNTKSLKLSWNKIANVNGYQLQRKSGDSWKNIANTSSINYNVKNLKDGTEYNFRVRAYKTINNIDYYSDWKTLKTTTKPSKVRIKSLSTNRKHQIIVKWNKVSNCSGYQIQFSKKKNFSKLIATKTVSGRSKTRYTGRNFTKGTTYYVRIRAYKTVKGTKYYSTWSSIKSIKCK